ncbi:MAG TPA: signal peptidase I [Terriglobia bacterium]|nr:signal peptidase I [Terriglobia bacterium]
MNPGGGEPDVRLGSLVVFDKKTEKVGVLPGDAGLQAPPAAPEIAIPFDSWGPVAGEGAAVAESFNGQPAALVEPDVPLGRLVIFERTPTPPAAIETAVSGEGFRKEVLWEWAESLAMVLAFILVFTGYIAQATQVPTESMKPTILVGDHFFIEKLAFPGNFPAAVRPFLPERAIRRGDIIVFRSPVDARIPFVKRVIGTPGDTVEIREKSVFVNGVQLDEPYKIHTDPTVYHNDSWTAEDVKKRDNYGPAVVPPDSFFVMGDNRDNSNDSRYWGYVGRDAIMGMPLFVYWSYRAEPYTGAPPTMSERLNDYVQTGVHFFSRTRWFRFGTLVQ